MASQCWCQKSIFRIQQFQLVVNLIYNVKCHDFPRHLSSNKYPKYLTLEFCLVCISTYFKVSLFIFFLLNLVAKCIDLVVSSSKCILSLLSTNQSYIYHQNLQVTVFFFQFYWYPYANKQGIKHGHREKGYRCVFHRRTQMRVEKNYVLNWFPEVRGDQLC